MITKLPSIVETSLTNRITLHWKIELLSNGKKQRHLQSHTFESDVAALHLHTEMLSFQTKLLMVFFFVTPEWGDGDGFDGL